MSLKRTFVACLATTALWACDDGASSEPGATVDAGTDGVVCVGKCDHVGEPPVETGYRVDLERVNDIWPGETPVTHVDELFSTRIILPGGQEILAATHLFGQPVNPIPYHDADGADVVDVNGGAVIQGDRELARFYPPGRIGYAIKHHRPASRVLRFADLSNNASADALKEDMKLQDTHIELVVGVRRPLGGDGEMVNGVITLNNPQTYQSGRFGDETYPMIFVRPAFPAYLDATLHPAFEDNIRTMMLAFNAVSTFPGDYNGGDPLAARDPETVLEHTRNMVLALAGEGQIQADAQAFFRRPENLIYCAELAHVSTSAGLLVPLNRAGLVESGLVNEATYQRFMQLLADHNRGESTPLTALNSNDLARYVTTAAAPEHLRPLPSYAADPAAEASKLAFKPLTMVEIVEGFLKTHIPRNDPRLGGEALAPVQGAVLRAMKPGLFEAMGLDDSVHLSMVQHAEQEITTLREDLTDPELSEAARATIHARIATLKTEQVQAKAHLQAVQMKRAAVETVFEEMVRIIEVPHADYDAFRAALAPLMARASAMAGPRDDSGVGLFVPPSALHLVAQRSCDGDDRCGGLIGLNYVGHGLPLSAVEVLAPLPPAPQVAVVRISDAIPRPSVDQNSDGVFNARQDESFALVNEGTADADLTGWTITDAVRTRFNFDGITIPAGDVIYVFGGVEPGFELQAGSYAAHGLGLNDGGDTLTLFNAQSEVIDQLSWGPVTPDQVVTADAPECRDAEQQTEACSNGARSRSCAHGEWTTWSLCAGAEGGVDTCDAPSLDAPEAGQIMLDNTGMRNVRSAACSGAAIGPEAAWTFELDTASHVAFEVTSADFDTVLYLHPGGCGGDAEALVCNDDYNDLITSRVEADLEPGLYTLFLDGYSSDAAGPATISVTID